MMKIDRSDLVKKIRYTDLVYERINKKLKQNMTRNQIEKMINELLLSTPLRQFVIKGKNIYVNNVPMKISVTINLNTTTVITVNPI